MDRSVISALVVILTISSISACKTRNWDESSGLLGGDQARDAGMQSTTLACRDLAESNSPRWTFEITGADLREEESRLAVTVRELSPEGITSYRTESTPGQGHIVEKETISVNFDGGVLTVRYGLEGHLDDYTGLLSLASNAAIDGSASLPSAEKQGPAPANETSAVGDSSSLVNQSGKVLDTKEVVCRLVAV